MKNPNVLNEYKSNEMYKMKFWKKTPSFFFDVPVSVKKKGNTLISTTPPFLPPLGLVAHPLIFLIPRE